MYVLKSIKNCLLYIYKQTIYYLDINHVGLVRSKMVLQFCISIWGTEESKQDKQSWRKNWLTQKKMATTQKELHHYKIIHFEPGHTNKDNVMFNNTHGICATINKKE